LGDLGRVVALKDAAFQIHGIAILRHLGRPFAFPWSFCCHGSFALVLNDGGLPKTKLCRRDILGGNTGLYQGSLMMTDEPHERQKTLGLTRPPRRSQFGRVKVETKGKRGSHGQNLWKLVAMLTVDSLLAIYAMYFELQDSSGWPQRRRALAEKALGPDLANFL
jgi:hypothetical protein